MTRVLILGILGVVIFSCSTRQYLRRPASTTSGLSENEFIFNKKAEKFEGTFEGLRKKGFGKSFKVVECGFLYEKAMDYLTEENRPYLLERFVINLLGTNPEGEISAETISFDYASLSKEEGKKEKSPSFTVIPASEDKEKDEAASRSGHRALNYFMGFGPKTLSNKLVNPNSQEWKMTYTPRVGNEVMILEREVNQAAVKNSTFFSPGQSRKYRAEVHFSNFPSKKMKVDGVTLTMTNSYKKSDTQTSTITCNNFSNSVD